MAEVVAPPPRTGPAPERVALWTACGRPHTALCFAHRKAPALRGRYDGGHTARLTPATQWGTRACSPKEQTADALYGVVGQPVMIVPSPSVARLAADYCIFASRGGQGIPKAGLRAVFGGK